MAKDIKFPRLNSIVISGHLTREVELRYTPKGTPVAKIGLAFNRVYQGQDGNWVEESNFLDVSVWGKQAELCSERLHKGSPVIFEGYLKTSMYTDKDNQQRKFVEIVANKIHFMEKTGSSYEEGPSGEPAANYDVDTSDQNVTDDDVPF